MGSKHGGDPGPRRLYEPVGAVLAANTATFRAAAADREPEATVLGTYGLAWERLREDWAPLLGLALLWGVGFALGELPTRLAPGLEGAVFAFAYDVLVEVPLGTGFFYAALRTARGERPGPA